MELNRNVGYQFNKHIRYEAGKVLAYYSKVAYEQHDAEMMVSAADVLVGLKNDSEGTPLAGQTLVSLKYGNASLLFVDKTKSFNKSSAHTYDISGKLSPTIK